MPAGNPIVEQAHTAHQTGRLEEAEKLYRAILAGDPGQPAAARGLSVLLFQRGLFGAADALLDDTIARQPRDAGLRFLRGATLQKLQRPAEAVRSFDAAIALQPRYAAALAGRGEALVEQGLLAEAIASFAGAIAANPEDAEFHYQRGQAEWRLQRLDDAMVSFEAALVRRPDYFEAWVSRGNILLTRRRMAEAVDAYDKALALQPDSAGALYNRGTALKELKRLDEALADYDKALALEPDLVHLEGARLHAKMLMCDWRGLAAESQALLSHVAAGKRAAMPFVILPIASTPAEQRIAARLYAAHKFPTAPALWRGENYRHDRLRIAYLSGGFGEHPVGLAMAGIFENHDRARFETVAISFAADDGGTTRRQLAASCDKFLDFSRRDDQLAAKMLREMEIDIAIDLDGFTEGSRTAILAQRPAPLQVNYLGFPCTMGAPYIDYLIADRVVVPDPVPYAEKIVWMPETFFPAGHRPEPKAPPSRRDCGLPDRGFVFCAFNNNYKITPDIFEVWMRLLHKVAGSVLWLRQMNPAVQANLAREAGRQGIAAERLIFAPTVAAREDHFARQQLADIFLDTLYYNAHSTAADALWCGVPVVTLPGPAFAGRVAASLLQAAGLDDLIAPSLEDYEALALRLAGDPALLASIKARIRDNRDACALFDARRFTRNLERAYQMMHERRLRGEAPESFAVA